MQLFDLHTGTIITRGASGVVLPASASDADIEVAAQGREPVCVAFDKFNDGRGFTIARILRDNLGFQGRLFAVGCVIPDQALFLYRAGFDAVKLTSDERLAAWRACRKRFSRFYQPSTRNPGILRSETLSDVMEGQAYPAPETRP